MFLREADDRQSRWNMQRREGDRRFELRQDRGVDEAMLPELRAPVNNSMSDCGRRRHPGVVEKPSDASDCFALAENGTRLGEQYASARIFCMEIAAFAAYRFGLAREQIFDPR